MMGEFAFWAPVIAAGLVGGGSTGLLGSYIVAMRIPFLGICVSHAALAGAVFGALAGLSGNMLLLPALGGAALMSLILGVAQRPGKRTAGQSNIVMGILFSLMMGLAFLGIGLFGSTGRSDAQVLGLLWGNLVFCTWDDTLLVLAAGVAEVVFVVLFWKELRAIMFDRHLAMAAGVRVKFVWTAFLILTSLILTINFQMVGGLMLYSLLANPAAAAFLLVKGYTRAVVASAIIGAISATGGFLVSLFVPAVPTGAGIVIFSSLVVLAAFLWRRFRNL